LGFFFFFFMFGSIYYLWDGERGYNVQLFIIAATTYSMATATSAGFLCGLLADGLLGGFDSASWYLFGCVRLLRYWIEQGFVSF